MTDRTNDLIEFIWHILTNPYARSSGDYIAFRAALKELLNGRSES